MVEIWMPYGETEVPITINAENLKDTIMPWDSGGLSDSKERPSESIKDRLRLKGLCQLVDHSDSIAICIDCQDSSGILAFTLSPIIEELCNAGVKEENITILLATGPNGELNEKEVTEIIKHLPKKVEVLSHDYISSDLVHVGDTSSGNEIFLNRRLMDSSFRILVGLVRPHFIAGYSGVESVILPGLAGIETILFNTKMSLQSESNAGKLKGNPVYQDIKEAAELVNVDYAINNFLDEKMRLIETFAGRIEDVLDKSLPFIENISKIEADGPVDVIIISPGGKIFDNNLYKACDIFYNIQKIIPEGNFIILISECSNGYGNSAFYEFMRKSMIRKNKKSMGNELKNHFRIGYEKACYLNEIASKNKVLLVSALPNYYVRDIFGLKTVETGNKALRKVTRQIGKDFKSAIIPFGSLTIPTLARASVNSH